MYLGPFPQNLQKYMNPIYKYVGKKVPKCLRCRNFDTFWKSVTSKTVMFWLFRHILVHVELVLFVILKYLVSVCNVVCVL